MAEVAEVLLPIGLQLRFALFGLECAFGVSFDGVECERVFRDAAEDQVSARQYLLFQSARLVVSGRVDEYEPETIWLRVQGKAGVGEVLRQVVAGAEFHAFRFCRSPEIANRAAPGGPPAQLADRSPCCAVVTSRVYRIGRVVFGSRWCLNMPPTPDETCTVYVALLEEGTPVLRPVEAECIGPGLF
jgi:hypothetical protein